MTKLKLAVIGGGALAEGVYLPLLVDHPRFQVVCLVENNRERASALQQKFNIPLVIPSFDAVTDQVEGAIIAAPNHLHKEITINLLQKRIHVLVEKPMALSVSDCEQMIEFSNRFQTRLMVAMVRRYYDNVQQVKHIINSKSLGELKHVEIQEGYVFNWPVTSDSLINKEKSGGGVLIDIGVHVLDVLYYWLGQPVLDSYYDDGQNSIEAECSISLSWGNTTAEIILSRLRNLTNKIKLQFDNGTVLIDTRSSSDVMIMLHNGSNIQGNFLPNDQKIDKLKPFKQQLDDFANLIMHDSSPLTSVIEATKGIALIQNCYQQKKPLSLQYLHF